MAMTPGWYPDPFSSQGYVRWWDGERWGASVLLPEGTPPPVPGQPVALPPPGQAPAAQAAPAPSSAPPPAGSYPPPQGWAPPPAPPYGAPAGQYGAPRGQEAPYEIASYGARAGARIIDWVLEGLLLVPISLWLLWPALTRLLDAMPADGSLPPEVLQQWLTDVTAVSIALTAATLVVTFLYEVPQHALYGRTIGKRLLGIRVRPRDVDSPRLTWGTASVRWAVESGATAIIGGLWSIVDYLWPLWDKPYLQTIHDKAAKTTVVPRRRL
jgi:uncharacterized RDD family membrane protein YckC